ncbi:MAG: hypothetical protein AABX40_02500, partial [Candidatus Hydrothermarchaeota archaeon]
DFLAGDLDAAFLRALQAENEELEQRIGELTSAHGAEIDELRKEFEEQLAAERKRTEERITEIKAKTKETIQKLIDEKGAVIDVLKTENIELKQESAELKEKLRYLEVERL